MTALIPFQFDNRTITLEVGERGEPWFRANDVCAALGYVNQWDAVKKHVDRDDLAKREVIDSLGRIQQTSFVNESGLYALIFGSKMECTKRFKKWVTSEVLPSIRKTGCYQAKPSLPQTYIEALKALLSAEESKQALAGQVDAMREDVDALARIAKADGSLSITDAAKTLQVSPKQLFDYLKAKGWIYTRIGTTYIGYQDKIVSGLLEHKVTTLSRPDGTEKTVTQVRVTPKGLARLAKEFSISLFSHVS